MVFDPAGYFRIMLDPPGFGRLLLASLSHARLFNP